MSNVDNPFDFSQYGTAGREPGHTSFGGGTPSSGPVSSQPATGFASSEFAPLMATAQGTTAAIKPPSIWLAGALVCAVSALVGAFFLGSSAPAAITAWVVGGPVAMALIAAFSLRDTRARTYAMYSSGPGLSWLYAVSVAASLAAVGISALYIANWAGRL